MSTQIGRPISDSTKRILEAAPALAERGLAKTEAARELGVQRNVFTVTVDRYFPDVEWRDGRADRPLADQTKRILDAAPALAKAGLTKSEAARELGVTPDAFQSAIRKRLPDVEWRNGRTDRRPLAEQTKRIIEAAPALAERGLSKSEAARELGVSPPVLTATLHRRGPDIQWRDGRERSGVTKRVAQSAPALARRGLSKSEAARELGVSPNSFIQAVRYHIPEVEWRDGRANARTTVGVKALAAEGLTQRDIARRLGISQRRVSRIVKKQGIECARAKAPAEVVRAPSTVKDDERSTMRRVMAETLAVAQQPPEREGGGIGR